MVYCYWLNIRVKAILFDSLVNCNVLDNLEMCPFYWILTRNIYRLAFMFANDIELELFGDSGKGNMPLNQNPYNSWIASVIEILCTVLLKDSKTRFLQQQLLLLSENCWLACSTYNCSGMIHNSCQNCWTTEKMSNWTKFLVN